VYETEGTEPVGVHEWADVRLLAPVGWPPSVRLFSPPDEELSWDFGSDQPLPRFEYLNSAALVGPAVVLPVPEQIKAIHCDSCIGIVIAGVGRTVSVEDADGLVLGLTLFSSFHAVGQHGGRARDLGYAIGPAITTPDELDDAVTVDERGRRYRFSVGMKVNSEEVFTYDLSSLPYTLAELLSHASETCVLHQGDIVAVQLGEGGQLLESGDQVQMVCEKLGALGTRIA
jgi:2-keto-4-pentenoate hydratase/2-oxohepta-3-ene-1,7-dioic acid hydratase in catechol pathway